MTNPSNMVRVRARNGGRASVYEANGWAQAFSAGLLEGNGVTQNTSADMHVLVGGSATKPDVVLATNPAGYKIALDIVSQQAVTITAPASNKRISAIVAYTDDLSLATTEDTVTGSPASCGLIVVNGTSGANPSAPTDTQIRNAITADGATGSQACYCVIATILVENSTSVITDSLITVNRAGIRSQNIDFTTIINNPDFIKVGTFTAVYQEDNSSGGFKEITFSSPFPSGVTPVVFVNNSLTTGRIGAITITSVTNSKFDILARHSGAGSTQSFDFYYIAINPKALAIEKA